MIPMEEEYVNHPRRQLLSDKVIVSYSFDGRFGGRIISNELKFVQALISDLAVSWLRIPPLLDWWRTRGL